MSVINKKQIEIANQLPVDSWQLHIDQLECYIEEIGNLTIFPDGEIEFIDELTEQETFITLKKAQQLFKFKAFK